MARWQKPCARVCKLGKVRAKILESLGLQVGHFVATTKFAFLDKTGTNNFNVGLTHNENGDLAYITTQVNLDFEQALFYLGYYHRQGEQAYLQLERKENDQAEN